MSEDQNIPAEQSTDDSQKAIEENALPFSESQLQTTNYQLQTDNMEVHNHPHHVTHKKKWGEYLLEFLMLFLAVFLGFVAENIREHAVEKERARQYASQLVSDLKIDSAQLDSSITLNSMIWKKLDTLRTLIDQHKSSSTGQLYYYGRFTTWYNRFTPNDATFQQMKSSGAVRYFHNPTVEKMISEYDRILRHLQVHETGEYGSLTEMWLLTGQIFRADILDKLNDLDKPREYYTTFMQNNYSLLSGDAMLLQRLSNLCRARQLWIRFKIAESLQPGLKAVTVLIQQLKKDYE
ncbi:MAG TPA: hypothetical protein VMY77_00595 [Chitinophagaceae bacterium]|nr:hypothetical protein [Chitinophagaceae bacterium]